MPIRKHGFQRFIKKRMLKNISNSKKTYLIKRTSTAIIILITVLITININSAFKGKEKTEIAETTKTEKVLSNSDKNVSEEGLETNSSPDNKSYQEILAIGDSVMLDISAALRDQYNNITIDGKVGRQMSQAKELVHNYAEFNNPNKAVIIELGTNGHFTDKDIDYILDYFSKAHIYLINVRVPRYWESDVNKTLKKKAEERDNVTLIDWYSSAINHSEFFADDGVHLEPKGIEALVSIIDTTIKGSN